MSVVLPCGRAGFAAPPGVPGVASNAASGPVSTTPETRSARRVGLDDERLVLSHNRDGSQQLGGLGTLPATHAGAYRRRAAYHSESLPRRLGVSRALVPCSAG